MDFRKKLLEIKCGVSLIGMLGLMLLGSWILQSDFGEFIQWWFTLLTLGIVFFPLTHLMFHRFHDGGWLFSKVIGIALSGWLMWMLSSIRILKFSRTNSMICIGIFLVLNVFIFLWYIKKYKSQDKAVIPKDKSNYLEKISSVLTAELIFLAFFLGWCYLRGFKPEAYGTEKFMDYGFMTTMMRADYMPPEDLWFSGNGINYYYVGQYIATYLTKLSGVIVGRGYNFMLMTLAALSFALPYSIMNNVMGTMLRRKIKKESAPLYVIPPLTGVLSGLAVSIAGNFHYPVYKSIVPGIRKILEVEEALEALGHKFGNYWFPDATRYIGYNPETADKTIHEFPSYSFVLGDLHAHVINIMFVLTVIALLFAWLLYREAKIAERKEILLEHTFWKEAFHPVILLLGFFIGLFHTTNFWDFPIYFVVAGAVILASNLAYYSSTFQAIKLTAVHAAVIFLLGKLVCLPFTLNFDQISTSIRIAEDHTPIYQLFILWGLPIITVTMFWVCLYQEIKKRKVFRDAEKHRRSRFFAFVKNLDLSDRFVLTLGLCAAGLILLPELIYVKDIYTGDFKRANTMFKLTYQAYIMFGLCMSYIMIKFLCFAAGKFQRIFGIISLFCLISTMPYFGNSVNSWFGDVLDRSRYKGLDASAFLKEESEDDYAAAAWLNENVSGTPVVLEVNGDSYTYHQRISVITGLPTVLGWKTHEWLWRSDESGDNPKAAVERADDIKTIYTSEDITLVQELIEKYKIAYLYVGELENNQYELPTNHKLLRSLGEVVFERPENESKPYATYIVKVLG